MRRESVAASLCALAFALTASQAPAQVLAPVEEPLPRYQIEIIAFSYRDFDPNEEHLDIVPEASEFRHLPLPTQRILDDEQLASLRNLIDEPIVPEPVPEPDPLALEEIVVADIPLIETPPPPNPRILLPEELELGDVLARLERLGAYTVLFHGGWEQDGMAEEVAVPMDLARLGSTNPSGWIRLHMNRFLHVRVDVAYDAETPPDTVTGSLPSFGFGVVPLRAPVYHLYEQRRVLRGELNYFDHPAFGILVVVRLAPERASENPSTLQPTRPSA
jgi:hypothetical protein